MGENRASAHLASFNRGLLAPVATPPRFLGDKAYDADDIRDCLAGDGSEAVIPSKANRRNPKPHDPIAYKMRNVIERSFSRLKEWRGIATRYDKKAANFLAGGCLASAATYWLH